MAASDELNPLASIQLLLQGMELDAHAVVQALNDALGLAIEAAQAIEDPAVALVVLNEVEAIVERVRLAVGAEDGAQ